MFQGNHYVPALKLKRGELAALDKLTPARKAKLTPLLEVMPIPEDPDTGDQKKTLDKHVDTSIEKIASTWGLTDPFFLDPADVAGSSAAGKPGALYVFDLAAQHGLRFIPVTSPGRSPGEIAAAVQHKNHGVCLRITQSELGGLGALPAFLAANGLSIGDTDLILDFGEVLSELSAFALAQLALPQVPAVGSWRTLTVLATSFPQHMGNVQSQTMALVDRVEWLAWLKLHAARKALPRLPAFGDHAIQHPEGLDGYDPRFMPASATIRYTVDQQWLIVKGHSSKKTPLISQFPALAKQLVADQRFYGAGHCVGCDNAIACAGGATGFGSAEAWRKIGTLHHISVAADQLAAVAFP